jgi:hypothetical protein
MTEIEFTSFKSTKHCFNPDEGKTIILPKGFGIKENLDIFTLDEETLKSSIKCPIFSCMLKEHEEYIMFTKRGKINLQYLKLYEKYLYFVGKIYRKYLFKINSLREDTSYRGTDVDIIPSIFFSMSSNSKEGIITNSLGMNKKNITRMVNFMIKYKFLELFSEQHSYIDYKKGETLADLKCRHFIVSTQLYRSPIKYKIRSEYITNHIIKQHDKLLNDALEGEGTSFEAELLSDEVIRSYTFPTAKKLLTVARKMVENKEKDKYGRTYSFGIPEEWYSEDNGKVITKRKANGDSFKYTIRGKLKPNCPYVDINIHIYNYILMMNGPKLIRKRKIWEDENGFYKDRFYCFLSMIPKWIRNEIKIDGEQIVEIDAQALHPRIVGKLYEEITGDTRPEFLEGDSHTKIAKMLNIDRSSAKLISLSYWNSKIIGYKTSASKRNVELFAKMDKYIIQNHSKLFAFLKYIKCEMKPIKNKKSSHSNMSVLLMDMETRIMENFFWDVQYSGNKTTFLYCYDSVAVKQSKYETIKTLFENNVEQFLK